MLYLVNSRCVLNVLAVALLASTALTTSINHNLSQLVNHDCLHPCRRLIVVVAVVDQDSFELACDFHQMYSTPCKSEDEGEASGWKRCLSCAVLFLVLASRSPMQVVVGQ